MATSGLYGSSPTGALIAEPGTQTPGLYGKSPNGTVVASPSVETSGLYGNDGNFGGTYFEWFIFQEATTQPATPTGGSWSFSTNIGTPPTGWSNTPPSAPTESVWVSIALVNSRAGSTLTWSTPGLFVFNSGSGLPILSGNGVPTSTIHDQLYIQLDTTPQTIWFNESGTWTELTSQNVYVDLVNDQTIGGNKTFTNTVNADISGNAANVTGVVAIANGGTGATNASDARANLGLGTAAVLDAGVALGVATLDAGGTVPLSQIPASIQGGVSYQGSWNASTNTPTLTSGVGTKGYYYVVSVAGNTNLDGITDWVNGDWAIFNGTVWQKIDNTDIVSSVNGYTGAVVLTYSDVGAANSGTNTNITSMTGVTGGISSPDYIQFDISPTTVPTAPGALYWDSADGNQTLSLVMANGDAVQQIGQEQYFRIKASSAITEGQVVMFTGTVGASGALTGAPATGLTASTASYVMGIATHNIATNGWGYITSFGLVRGINTSSFSDGDILYYNPSVAGGLTTTIPSAPNAKIQVCAVVHAATNGSLFVRPSFGGILGQYEGDVGIGSYANGQTLIRDQSTGKWVNATLTAGSAISITNGAGSVTIDNTAPDQVVSISAGSGISVTGSYPNFTVTNTSSISLPVSISDGGTGATTIAGAQTNLQVDPAGTAVAMAIALG